MVHPFASMKKQFTWRDALDIATFAVVLGGMIIALIQLRSANEQLSATAKGTSEQLTAQLNAELSNKTNTDIIATIDQGKLVRQKNGGLFTDYELDNYLGIYEVMNGAYLSKQITHDDFCSIFSFYIDQAYADKEIKDYIAEIRNEYGQSGLFGGFMELAGNSMEYCK